MAMAIAMAVAMVVAKVVVVAMAVAMAMAEAMAVAMAMAMAMAVAMAMAMAVAMAMAMAMVMALDQENNVYKIIYNREKNQYELLNEETDVIVAIRDSFKEIQKLYLQLTNNIRRTNNGTES